MKVGLMVEGQNGLTWERWRHILQLAERLHFPTVFRSDHYFIGTQQDSLEAYLSFVMAAEITETIRFGPLVTPVTFRHPVDIGRMAAQIDQLSGGRFVMGLGAGWNEPEHDAYGLHFPGVKERFDRLDEAIGVIKGLWGEGPATIEGEYYSLKGPDCMPTPSANRPPVLIGGGGEKRTLRITAEHATEWNSVNLTPDAMRHKLGVLESHCADVGRDPSDIYHSMMAFALIGPDQEAIDHATERVMGMFGAPEGTPLDAFRAGAKANGSIVGSTDEVVEQLKALAEAGLQEVIIQHFDFDSDRVPEYLAAEIAPRVADF